MPAANLAANPVLAPTFQPLVVAVVVAVEVVTVLLTETLPAGDPCGIEICAVPTDVFGSSVPADPVTLNLPISVDRLSSVDLAGLPTSNELHRPVFPGYAYHGHATAALLRKSTIVELS